VQAGTGGLEQLDRVIEVAYPVMERRNNTGTLVPGEVIYGMDCRTLRFDGGGSWSRCCWRGMTGPVGDYCAAAMTYSLSQWDDRLPPAPT
jgi:hypothetical protein